MFPSAFYLAALLTLKGSTSVSLWSPLFPATKLQIKGMELKVGTGEGRGGWEMAKSVFSKVLASTGGEKDYF